MFELRWNAENETKTKKKNDDDDAEKVDEHTKDEVLLRIFF